MRLIPTMTSNGVTPISTVTASGTLTSGSATVTGLTNTALFRGALYCEGTGVPVGALVTSVDSATQVTLSEEATSSGRVDLTFTVEPIALAEAKKHARVEFGDDDELIATLITAARLYCESQLRSGLLTQSWTLYLDSFPCSGGYYNLAVRQMMGGYGAGMGEFGGYGTGYFPGLVPSATGAINLPYAPVQSVESVQYLDANGTLQTLDTSAYIVSLGVSGRVSPVSTSSWPVPQAVPDSVRVNFTAGYGDTSDKVPANVKAAMKLMVAHWYENREWGGSGTIFATVPQTVDALLAPSETGAYY